MKKQTYCQPQKKLVRQESLKAAINILTKNRKNAPVVKNTYVRDVYTYLLKSSYYAEYVSNLLFSDDSPSNSPFEESLINSWEDFHSSIVKKKSVNDLTVAYLCGPEPLNDFKILTSLGIHPCNIWAFENQKVEYNEALHQIKRSDFPLLKIYSGSIIEFFENVPKRFDLICIDACGPLPSTEQKTLSIIATLFRYHRLYSPGVLLTTFSSPDISNEETLNSYAYLIGQYLYTKEFLEDIHKETKEPLAIEGPIADGYSDKEFINIIKNNFDQYYGQYITRQIFDLASIIIPWVRLSNSNIWNKLFKLNPKNIIEHFPNPEETEEQGNLVYHMETLMKDYPFISLTNGLPNFDKDNRYPSIPKNAKKLLNSWQNQLNGNPYPSINAINAVRCFNMLRGFSVYLNHEKGLFNDTLSKILISFFNEYKMVSFCDTVTPDLGFYPITGQYSYPMHYNTEQVKRWMYKAKETNMFTDMIVFDECRYIYEWIPTLDLVDECINNISQQFILRFAIDGLSKQVRWYNTEYYQGTAIIGDHERQSFNSRYLLPRTIVQK